MRFSCWRSSLMLTEDAWALGEIDRNFQLVDCGRGYF
jgi:hypothetical protein